MREDMIKGFMLGGLNVSVFKDKERHLEETKNALGQIAEDQNIENLLDELIEEGWIDYNQKGNNIQTSTPEGVQV